MQAPGQSLAVVHCASDILPRSHAGRMGSQKTELKTLSDDSVLVLVRYQRECAEVSWDRQNNIGNIEQYNPLHSMTGTEWSTQREGLEALTAEMSGNGLYQNHQLYQNHHTNT